MTLTGAVEWQYERAAARCAIAGLTGVSAVVNDITLNQRLASTQTAGHIRAALIRNATIDAAHVHVTTAGTTVTLAGRVRSHAERQQAESTAWASPHVERVLNDIVVGR
ncbi:BON domain-containing protein [Clavibacter capsici]|uniref:BON domain-containing protein n=1 Tax=Clavibacter capsici TaxID=1874630 RepID=UPI001FCEAAB8|nr:BON domain-containing protein [Clavibacter capsici]